MLELQIQLKFVTNFRTLQIGLTLLRIDRIEYIYIVKSNSRKVAIEREKNYSTVKH